MPLEIDLSAQRRVGFGQMEILWLRDQTKEKLPPPPRGGEWLEGRDDAGMPRTFSAMLRKWSSLNSFKVSNKGSGMVTVSFTEIIWGNNNNVVLFELLPELGDCDPILLTWCVFACEHWSRGWVGVVLAKQQHFVPGSLWVPQLSPHWRVMTLVAFLSCISDLSDGKFYSHEWRRGSIATMTNCSS